MKKHIIIAIVATIAFTVTSDAMAVLLKADAEKMKNECHRLGPLFGPLCYDRVAKGYRYVEFPDTPENRKLLEHVNSLEYVPLPTGKLGCQSMETEEMKDYCNALKASGKTGYWRKKKQ